MKEVKLPSHGSFAHADLLSIEKNFNITAGLNDFQYYWRYTFYWSAVYILLMYSLQLYMRNKLPIRLQNVLIVWNLLLSIFNITGVIRGVPELLAVINLLGIQSSICNYALTFHSNVGAFWIWIFAWSKVIELGDTLFIVCRKRPLTSLHLIHHSLTLIVTWYFCSEGFLLGTWLTTMNYFVHSFMYTYYTLRALCINVPTHIAMVITIMQMMQLFCGFIMPFYMITILLAGKDCHATYTSCVICTVTYGLYFILFSHYFYKTYIKKEIVRFEDRLKCMPNGKID